MKDYKQITFNNIRSKHIFYNIYGIAQKWRNKEIWSCIDNPRPKHGFMFIVCDEVTFTFKDKSTQTFVKDNLIYIPMGIEYKVSFKINDNPPEDYLVNFSLRDFYGQHYQFFPEITLLIKNCPYKIANKLIKICDLIKSFQYPNVMIAKTFYEFLELMITTEQKTEDETNGKNQIASALHYIDSHVDSNITVPELAKMCLLSESFFRKIFKDETGLSPTQYKLNAKINKACHILVTMPEFSIGEISETIGFYDVSAFYKAFVSVTGTTPNQYRKSH